MGFDAFSIIKTTYEKIDTYENNFCKISHVKTDLLYGSIKNTKTYALTVIIPTYRRTDLLKEAINSVLKQKTNKFNWEIIIIDNTTWNQDHMTPALKIVREIDDSRILYYHNDQNIGSGYNWNRAVELARGKWITFLHDDDVLCSDALENIYNIICASHYFKKPLGYIHARSKNFTKNFNENTIKLKTLPFNLELTRLTTLILGHTHTGMPTCGTTILREAYIKSGGINYDFGPTADAVLGYIIMKNYTVLRSGTVLGGYRWINNETLKIKTIEKLIQSDYLFAQYRYKQSFFSKIWGIIFSDAQLQDNINVKRKLLIKYNKIEISSENEILTKKHTNIVMLFIYKIFIMLCKFTMVIKGILWLR